MNGDNRLFRSEDSAGPAPQQVPDLARLRAAVTVPFEDVLVVGRPQGGLYALDAASRRLWEALAAGFSLDEVVEAAVEFGGLSRDVARRHVLATLAAWYEAGLFEEPVAPLSPEVAMCADRVRPPAQASCYKLAGTSVWISCNEPCLARLLEVACAGLPRDPLERPVGGVQALQTGECFAIRNPRSRIKAGLRTTRSLRTAKHFALTAMIESALYDRRLLGVLHASAISDGERCIAIAGVAGAGKSTLTAALVSRGAKFVSDDYLPLESGSWLVHPVPYPLTIKQGSLPLLRPFYDRLEDLQPFVLVEEPVRYLIVPEQQRVPQRPLPLAALVFPRRWDNADATELTSLSVKEAFFELCAAHSMLDEQQEALHETLRWIQRVPAFALTYDDLEPALDAVQSLFERP